MTSIMAPLPSENPYMDDLAVVNSSYLHWIDDALVRVDDGEAAPSLADRVHGALRAVILDPEFPCVGARSAMNQGSYRFAMYDELDTAAASAGLAHDEQRLVLTNRRRDLRRRVGPPRIA